MTRLSFGSLTASVAEDLGLERDDVLAEVQAQSITANTGMDFKQKDLESFLTHTCNEVAASQRGVPETTRIAR